MDNTPGLIRAVGDFFGFLGEHAAASGWLGLVVSIAGFTATFLQIRRTRTATEAASKAAERTVQALRRQQRAVSVSRLQGIVRSVDEAVQANHPGPISFLLNDWRDEGMRLVGLVQTEVLGPDAPDLTDLIASLELTATAIAAVIAAPHELGPATAEARQIMKRAMIPVAVWAANPALDTEAVDR